QRREIVDEVEWVLDLVRDPRGKLAERGQLFGLDQTVLGRTKVVERLAEVVSTLAQLAEQTCVLDSNHSLPSKIGQQIDLFVAEQSDLLAIHRDQADHIIFPQHGYDDDRSCASKFRELDRGRSPLKIGRSVA